MRNLIRSGVVTEVDIVQGLCRVQSGGIQTTWLNWLTTRAGRLEDSVTPNDKAQARKIAMQFLSSRPNSSLKIALRINGMNTHA
ncbi:phage baseplate assembly protein V, partial [Salmonella enterica subsp. enterica serovar Montevideo]|nr:phage baseplate assembly protein V [Salmonella enterica subsp. enterica serovar Montevideo]